MLVQSFRYRCSCICKNIQASYTGDILACKGSDSIVYMYNRYTVTLLGKKLFSSEWKR